jgi:hypothetical protein
MNKTRRSAVKLLSKFFLWLMGVAIPVVIAACYGPMYSYSKSGKVLDSDSKEGINNIQVSCLSGGTEQDMAYTNRDGTFWLTYDYCDELKVEDIDGEDNGGIYLPRTIPFDPDCVDLTIELHK